MGDALIDQFCSAYDLNNMPFLRRCQREFRDRVQPMLDQVEILTKRVEELEAENAQLRKKKSAA